MAEISSQTKELTTKQTRAIAALLTTKDVGSAAKEARIGERTLYTWLDNVSFRAALKQAEAHAIEKAVSLVSGMSQYAVSVIVSLMANERVSDGVRLRAAQTVLDQMVKLREYADLEARVAALEATVEAEERTKTGGNSRTW